MKCPQCERFCATAEAVVRHRQVAHHNIRHPCKCGWCDAIFQTWKERRQHYKEKHEPQNREGEAESSTRSSKEDVSVLPTVGCVPGSNEEARTHAGNPSHPADIADQASDRAIQGVAMGNRTPRSRCDFCFEWFPNKNSLEQHRESTGHKTLLLEQSRYSKLQCQPVD